jgi:protein-tyrosine phosphatase
VSDAASPETARAVPLEGACNFRDLGGWPMADGRRMRRGVLYRSGTLAHLTPADHQRLGGLGLKVICDLRRDDECQQEPTRWATPVAMRQWPIEKAVAEAQRAHDWLGEGDEHAIVQRMSSHYRTMPEWLRPHVRGVFHHLLDDDVPLLFHCAAGKDRTGFVAALVLHALGVPDDLVREDYLLTNAAGLYEFMRRQRKTSVGIASVEHPLDRMSPGARQALLGADERYLAAALATVQQSHGSMLAYLADVTGFAPGDFAALRARFGTSSA